MIHKLRDALDMMYTIHQNKPLQSISDTSRLVRDYQGEPSLQSSAGSLLFWKTNEHLHVYSTLAKIAKQYPSVNHRDLFLP